MQGIISTIDLCLRSSQSNRSFNWIKRLSILNPNKRDGGLMTCQLDENNAVTVDSSTIIDNCLKILETYSGSLDKPPPIGDFPSLPPISIDQAVRI